MNVYLEYQGLPRLIRDLVWAGFAPCGCIESALNADAGGEVIATPAHAKTHMADGSKLRESRDPDAYVMFSREDFPWDAFKGDCQHDPRYGRPVTPVPDGYGWATSAPTRGLHHLAPNGPRDWSKAAPRALCDGGGNRPYWRFDEHLRFSTVPCLKCSALAVGAA